MSLYKSGDDKSSNSAKEIYSGALPTARDRHWLKEVGAEDMARYPTDWKMQRNMSVCLTLLAQGM